MKKNTRLALTALSLAAVTPFQSAYADSISWTGGTDTSWTNGANWGGTAPADDTTTDIVVFNGSSYTNQPTLDVLTNQSVNGLSIGGASTAGVTLSSGTKITTSLITSGSNTITLTDTTSLAVGQNVIAANIPSGTVITAIDTGTNTITLSQSTTKEIASASSIAFAASLATSGATSGGSSTITLANTTGVAVGQNVTGNRIPLGTFITAVDTDTNTITLSQPTSGGTLNDATSLTFTSALKIGGGGITLEASTPNVTNLISAPIVLATSQEWNNNAARSLQIQGAIYLDNNTLTLKGVTGSTISFNGSTATQSISGSGNIIVDTDGTVSFGPGSGGRQQNSFTGGVTLNKGTITINGGNSGGGGGAGGLGTGVLTINGGSISGAGNIAGHALTISGQVWNADWTFSGGKAVDMGTGGITLGTAAGASRTLTSTSSLALTLGGGLADGATANHFIKAGSGTVNLNGANTLTGNYTVSEGAVAFGETGSTTFYIGANGVNNAVDGAGAAAFNGTFVFDLTGASLLGGNTWTIVDLTSLTASFAGTFAVQDFTDAGDGTWTFGNFTFSELTGQLTYAAAIPEPSAAAFLAGLFALALARLRRRPAA